MSVYLDHNATSPVRPAAAEAVMAALAGGGNPSSVHQSGRAARARVEQARATIARSICARSEDLIFTSGGTESNNLSLHASKTLGCTRIILSQIEHDAVRAAAAASGLPTEEWPVDAHGRARLDWLRDRLAAAEAGERIAFALMAANNETGVIQPYAEAGRMIAEVEGGHLFLIDAVQMTGKANFDFAASFAQFAALSSHKAGGPQGVGALATACDAQVGALITGGGQEKGRRGGTENVAGVVGFAAAVSAIGDDETSRIASLRDRIERRLKAAAPEITIWGEGVERLPNTICLSAPGWPSEIQVIALDLAGFAVSAGSACSSGKVRKSHVLKAMGATDDEAGSALRVSLGWTTTEDDADAFCEAWLREYDRVRPKVAAAG
ncbi:cysteine desulfurase [Maricaulaceae bacterium NA33B04]|nr:cysteine desulfurase [Maricaulaceae bacterium NA33B04]